MTQKSNLFKGQQKRKTIPPNRHGKVAHTRKGKRFVKASKSTSEMDTDREVTKFMNHCNEMKAATAANKEGGQRSLVKPPPEVPSKKKKLTVETESGANKYLRTSMRRGVDMEEFPGRLCRTGVLNCSILKEESALF